MPLTQEITFFNGNVRLVGTLHQPASEQPLPALVVTHAANAGTRNDRAYAHLIESLPRQGMAVFVYDRRGHGESGGDWETASFEDLADDALAAVHALQQRDDIDSQRIGLYGISQGGWIAPIAAAKDKGVKFLVIVSGSGVTPAEQMKYGATRALRAAGYGEEDIKHAMHLRDRVDTYYRGHAYGKVVQTEIDTAATEAWFDLAYLPIYDDHTLPADPTESKWYYQFDYDPLTVWAKVHQPTLFLYGEDDIWVPIDTSMDLYRDATTHLPNVQFARIMGSDHMMRQLAPDGTENPYGEISERYIEMLSGWLQERLA